MKIPSNSRGVEHASLRDVLRAAISDAVTISEAAQILGVTARTVQRRIEGGDLKSIEVDGTRFVCLSTPGESLENSPGSALSAETPSVATSPTVSQAETVPIPSPMAEIAPVTPSAPVAPPAPAAAALSAPSAFADNMATRYMSQLESENAFLRLQIEAHARAEAELRTALREALRAMPKALAGSGANEQPVPAVPSNQQEPVETKPIIVEPTVVEAVSTHTTATPIAKPAAEVEAKIEEPKVEAPKAEVPKIVEQKVEVAPAPAEPAAQVAFKSPPSTPAGPPAEKLKEVPAPVSVSLPAQPDAVATPAETQPQPTEEDAPVKIVTPPFSHQGEHSKGGYKSVYEQRRTSRPFWKVFLGMR